MTSPLTLSAGGPLYRRAAELAPPLLLIVVGLALTQVLTLFQEVTLTLWLIYGLLALSMSVVWGKAGIFSFGQTALFGLAGYAFGVVGINLEPHTGDTLLALVAAAAVAGGVAAILGYVMFYGRVSDVYVAIITLAFTLVLLTVFGSTASPKYHVGDALIGGYNGMTGIPPLELHLPNATPLQLDRSGTYMFTLAVAGLAYLGVVVLLQRPFGRVLAAIRDNEMRTSLLGYDVRKYKLIVFAVGGAIAGLAGACYGAWGGFLNPQPFSLPFASLVVIWVMVGGRSSLSGAFLGAIAVSALSAYLGGALASETTLVLGAVFIATVLLLPNGIVPLFSKWARILVRYEPNASAPAPAMALERPKSTSRLTVSDVAKRFGGVHALNGVSLEFEPNRLYCLIGPNGAGKSTLFSLLAGQNGVTSGRIRIAESDVTKQSSHERARLGLGIKLQVPAIYRTLTVAENIWLAAYARYRDARKADGLVTATLEEVGLSRRRNTIANELSHGEQQWVEMGMVLSAAPQIILLDEPTAGMTHEETLKTVELVKRLGETATVVVVEHDMEFVARLGAPITLLHQGKVFASGSYSTLREMPEVLDIYLGRPLADTPVAAG